MGVFDKIASIFKPGAVSGSDAEPSSWAAPSTFSIPAAGSTPAKASTGAKKDSVGSDAEPSSWAAASTFTIPKAVEVSKPANGVSVKAGIGSGRGTVGYASEGSTPSQVKNTEVGGSAQDSVVKPMKGFDYSRPSDKLSERARRNGIAAGEDYDGADESKKNYVRVYYATLDRDEVTKPYLELEKILNSKNYEAGAFNPRYQELLSYIDQQMEEQARLDYERQLSIDENMAGFPFSAQYRAWEQVREDVVNLGRQYAVNKAYDQTRGYSDQLDESLTSIFAGVISSPDYRATVEAGKKSVFDSGPAKRWFSRYMRYASPEQQDLWYYTYEKDGFSSAKELFNDYLGETVNTVKAGQTFADTIADKDSGSDRFFEMGDAALASALDGQWWGGTRQTFLNTESDPSNRELIAGYTANDAVDYSLRNELGAVVDTPEFQQMGDEGFGQMRVDGVTGDWYEDMRKNATAFQKQVIGSFYLASEKDAAAVEEIWRSIKESEEQVWSVVKGANTLPNRSSSIAGQMYRDYLGMSGGKPPKWLSNGEDQTTAQLIWDATTTTAGQLPQVAGQILGTLLSSALGAGPASKAIGAVTGAAAMTTGAYGNAYKEARDEGYTKKQSQGYASTEAASEFLADMLFSGVGPTGGLLNNAATEKIVKNIAQPVTRAFVELGINALSEGGQEYLQEIFEPVVRNFWFDEDNDVELYTEDARYNFFMGAFSSVLLGDPTGQVRANLSHAKIGNALNSLNATSKLADKVLATDIDSVSEESRDSLKEAKALAEKMNSGGYKGNDVNAGELLDKAVNGGVDVGFLDNPSTVSYTKEQLTVEDMRAGAVSRLAALGGDTTLAEDVARMAKGQSVSEETQSKINNDQKATQVLQELQGEMDLEQDNALTIAARMSQVEGAMAKISGAVNRYNPNKVILTPAEQYLSEQGVGLAESQRIGAVLNKVMDGKTITRDEAKLVRVKDPAVQGAVLATLGVDLHESIGVQGIMDALNEKAAEVARVKEMQSGVRQVTAQAKAANRSGKRPDSKATQNAKERRRRNKNGTKSTGVQTQAGAEAGAEALPVGGNNGGVSAVVGAAQAGGPGQVRSVGEREEVGRDASVRRPGLGPGRNGDIGDVIPVDQLTEKQRNTQRRLAADGFGSIHFMNGGVSHTGWNEDLGCYEVYIRVDGPFDIDQYSDHETGHLWIKSLSDQDRRGFLFKVMRAFGEDFREAFTQIKQKYVGLGKFSRDVDEATVIEEMYCFARGAQNCAKKGFKDSILKFDFSKYHDAMLEIEQFAALEAMAKGDLNNEQVRRNYENGNFNRDYYEKQGYLEEDFAQAPAAQAKTEQRTEARQTLDKLAGKKEQAPAKTEKTAEVKQEKPKKSKSKKATIPSKSEADELKELYAQRKAAQERKFKEGKLKKTEEQLQNKLKKLDAELQEKLEALAFRDKVNDIEVTPEAIARAEKLTEDVRNDLISELAGLQAELKADPSIADNTGFLTRVQAWFEKAKAAIEEANAEPAKRPALEELKAIAEEAKAHPELADDPAFRQRAETALALATAEIAERAANAQVSLSEVADEAQQETKPAFDYDTELKKLDDWRNARRKSQYEKMAKNPEKSDESLNAQLRKIEDQYQYKKQALAAKARRNGDTRFSVDPDTNMEERDEQEGLREDTARGNRLGNNSAGGHRLGEHDLRAGSGKNAVRDRAAESNGRGTLQPNAAGTSARSSVAGGHRLGGQPAAEPGIRSSGRPGQSRRTERQLTRNLTLHNQKRRDFSRNGIKLLSESQVRPEVAEAGRLVKKFLPDCNVSYYFNPRSFAVAMFCDRADKNGSLYDAGIFINAAAFEADDIKKVLRKAGLTPRKAVSHEMGHYYLYYASVDERGKATTSRSLDAFDYLMENYEGSDAVAVRAALQKTRQEYKNLYKNDPNTRGREDRIVEELISDLFGNIPRYFKTSSGAFLRLRDLAREYFGLETEFGDNTEKDRMAFSVDPDYETDFDTEELMDRRDEMRSDYDEAQVWDLGGRDEHGNATPLSGLSEDEVGNRLNELMDELLANPERADEIYAQMEAIQRGGFNETSATMERFEEPKKQAPKKAEARKPVIPPKAPAPKAEVKAEPARVTPPPAPEPAAPAFDVALSEVSGPVNVAGLTLGKAKDAVYQARRDLQRKASLTADDQARINALTEQYDKIQALIEARGKSLADPKAKYNLRIEGTRPLSAAAKAFKPKAAKENTAKNAPVTEAASEVKKPEMRRGKDPVDVKGLSKKKAIEKVTRDKTTLEKWYAQEKTRLDKLFDSKALDDAGYTEEFAKLTKEFNRRNGRYEDQLKRLGAMDEPVKNKPTVIKDEETSYTPKTGEWWKRVRNGTDIQIRRLRDDRNTYDVAFTDSKGNRVVYESISPSMLEKALGEGLRSKADAKALLSTVYENATTSLGAWQSVDYAKLEIEKKEKLPKPDRALDSYGRKVPYKMEARMANSTVRDSAGRLLSVYRLGPANGVRNANPNTRFTLWTERPASMNLMRGLNGADAYDQVGKGVGADIEKWLQELADHPRMSEANKNAIRAKIAAAERKNREYTTHLTRLDPWRPDYSNPKREDVIGGHTLLEGYVDIRNPLVIDAQGKGMAYVRDTVQDYLNDPANLAGQVDADGNPLGDYDGIKFINVTVTDGNKTLGGGQLDRDNVYVTFRQNQGKSTYNTDPTDSDLMQFSIDPDTETGYAEGTLEDTILRVMRDKDEAHAIETLAMYMAQFFQTGVLPKIENERTRNIFQRQIAPGEEDFLRQKAAELIGKYGRLEQGETPARDVAFPRRTEDGNIRRVFRTAAESKNTPQRAVPFITREAMTLDGATYQTITDKSAIAAADRDMRSKGFDQMLAEWRAKADSNVEGIGGITKYDIAKAEMLYIEAAKVGDMETAMQTLAELAEVGTTAGQVVQAMRMLKSMPASYQLYYMRRVVNRLNRQYAKRINSGRMSELKVNKDLARAILNAQTQEQLDVAMENLIRDVAGQIPATIADKWNAWRYLSMLGNPKTHIRNILGNAIFMPAKFSKDVIAAGLEGMFIKDRSERRTSLKGVLGRNTEYREFAKADYEGIKEELQSGGKYNPANKIMDARTIFKSKALEFLRKFNGEKLEQEDGLFLRTHYVNALTSFLATQGMSVKDLTTTKEGRKILNAARLYAFNEAQKATYRDASRFAAALNQMKRESGPVGILLEGIFPFTKTPINILKRGVEYSPVGLLKSLSYDAMKLKSGEISANDFIDSLASGLTGTGIAALGAWLASLGVLRGGGDDDDNQDEFDQLQGYQKYSITIGNHNFTIDWTAPSALPLFVGCEIFNQMQEGNELTDADLINALSVIAEPITQLSMLSGLNETLKSAKWDDNPTSSILMSMGSGYLTQALPTLVAQFSRSLSADRRTTYVDKNSDVPQPIQRWWQTNVLGKTPLNDQRTEYIDAWGRKDTTSSFAVRLFENMLSPGYINRIKTTAVDAELQKLADSVGTGVLMTAPEKKIEFNNESHNLTADQYQTYAKARGDAAMTMLSDLFGSEGYQDEMTDSEKAYAVKLIKDYANAIGKKAVFNEYDPTTDNWAEKCDGDPTRVTNTAILKAIAHDAGVTFGNNSHAYALIVEQSWLTPVDQGFAVAQLLDLGSDKYVYEGKGSPKYTIGSEEKQIIAEHFRQIFPAYYVELADSEQWKNADSASRVALLSDVRADAKADAKAWMARILAQQGAPLYEG